MDTSRLEAVIESFRGEHRFLSNFYPARVCYDGWWFPTVEHAYQGAKTEKPDERTQILEAPTPGKAKQLSRGISIRHDWEDVKVEIMRNLVFQKFNNHSELKEKLLATGKTKLIEGNTWGDKFWGMCNGEGENWLGKILMEVREELRNG
jgi:ribA/ribD-fused uncharacterized protein